MTVSPPQQHHSFRRQEQPRDPRRREDLGYSRTVSYDEKNSLSLICQRWGSITRKVAPFCFWNVLLSGIVLALLEVWNIDLTMSESGHEFMSILVSFLVINKLSYTIDVYYEMQGYLATMNQSMIELTQLMNAFSSSSSASSDHQDDHRQRQGRYNTAKTAIVLLKTTCAIIHKYGDTTNVWEMEDFKDHPLLLKLPKDDDNNNNNDDDERHGSTVSEQSFPPSTTKGRRRSNVYEFPKEMYVMEEELLRSDYNLKIPIRIAQELRTIIVQQRLDDKIQEMQLLDRVTTYMTCYHGIRKYLVAPLPLPWVQLGRLFTFAYVFTLPFALLSANLALKGIQVIFLTLIMTYGFVGCELLFVELNDPFAEDPNDLPLVEELRATIEDIMLSLYYVDGKETILKLKADVTSKGYEWWYDFYGIQLEKHKPLFPLKKMTEKKQDDYVMDESDPLL